ncbi:MAG: hypothetical protein HY549_03110 [Elusimicrobia bacterium]|nr:hypothetical protein [Elusimicrobiota bacterium]
MVKRTAVMSLAALALAAGVWAHEGHKHEEKAEAAAPSETVSVTGEVLDLSCYLGHGATGKEHKKCAKSCLLEKHVSAGLLTADGTVYLLVSDHKHEKAFAPVGQMAAEQVKVTGVKAVKGGLQAILVHKVEKA